MGEVKSPHVAADIVSSIFNGESFIGSQDAECSIVKSRNGKIFVRRRLKIGICFNLYPYSFAVWNELSGFLNENYTGSSTVFET